MSSTTKLPPSSIGSGALYNHNSSSTTTSLRTAPIAHFSSTPNDGIGNESAKKSLSSSSGEESGIPTAGHLLAINSTYIAYAVKKGLVRVIHRINGTKTLLRGHNEGTRIIDATFFGSGNINSAGGGSGGEGVGVNGLWNELSALHNSSNSMSTTNNTNSQQQLPPAAASDVLATIGGYGDATSSILIWRISSTTAGLGADKLLQISYGNEITRLVWHPFNPNRFIVLHRSTVNGMNSIHEKSEMDGNEDGRIVATLVETTRLTTQRHETDGHMVCNASPSTSGDNEEGVNEKKKTLSSRGLTPFIVSSEDSNNSGLLGANDISISNNNAKFALTGHDDGYIRLWDINERKVMGEDDTDVSIPCVSSVNTAISGEESEEEEKKVTHVIFLSQYEDSTSSISAITPPFITGTNMNHTVTLWSSFTSSGSKMVNLPSRLRIFKLQNDTAPLLSSLISMELCPAPYRPPEEGSSSNVVVPSSFLLLAERKAGILHALHLDTDWKEQDDNSDYRRAGIVTVKGFDYVSTLNVVHPIYSFCVAPTAFTDGTNIPLKEERDVDLCCIQSKAVQMLTLSADMVPPPDDDGEEIIIGGPVELADGVTLLNLPTDDSGVVSDDEDDGANEEFEDDYEMDEPVEYSTNNESEDDDDEEEEEAVLPTAASESKPNAFSNWLGAIAKPFSGGAPAAEEEDDKPSEPVQEEKKTVVKSSPAVSPLPPGFESILPPPPPPTSVEKAADPLSFVPSPPTPPTAPVATPNNTVLLSPMQLLSESGGDDVPAESTTSKKTQENLPDRLKAVKKSNKKKSKDDGNKKTAPATTSNKANEPAPQPMKILLKPKDDTPSTSDNAVVSSNVDISAIEATVNRVVAAQMKSHETQLLASLRKVISTEVASAMKSSGKDVDKAIEQGVQRGITKGGLGKALEKHMKESAALAAKEAVNSMQPAIVTSLHETMREVMIPAYEAATREMFQQTSTSLEKGLAQMSVNHQNASVPTMQQMSKQMMKMGEAIQSLSAEVKHLRGDVNAHNAATQNGSNPGQPPPAPQPMGVRNEITALCQAQRYEEAFTKAVSASDGEIVLFACQQSDAAAVFNGEASSISQPILICLLQQLGAVLVTATDAEDIKTILTWLQEIAVTIDPSNTNIQRHVASVVQQLLVNINSKLANCEPQFRRQLQTLMRVIRGMA